VTAHSVPQPECFECPCVLICISGLDVLVYTCFICGGGMTAYILEYARNTNVPLDDREVVAAFVKCARAQHGILPRHRVAATPSHYPCEECKRGEL
jgi:hypothetical protein